MSFHHQHSDVVVTSSLQRCFIYNIMTLLGFFLSDLSKLSEPAKYFACQLKLEITESEIIEHEDYLH